MPSHENPFPGMNPYLQDSWENVHTMLVAYIQDALSPELPPDLVVRAEERLVVDAKEEEKLRTARADVAIVERWKEGFPPVWMPEDSNPEGGAVVDVPLLLLDEPEVERWVEIRDARGLLITVIELLSPTNKRGGEKWEEYRGRQRRYLSAGVNLVEIDLIRGGVHTVAIASDLVSWPRGTHHIVCVARPQVHPQRREIYISRLRERLPIIRVPLRLSDPDLPLALQPLLDRCYRLGRHWLTAYARPLAPPLPPEEQAWADERLHVAGIR